MRDIPEIFARVDKANFDYFRGLAKENQNSLSETISDCLRDEARMTYDFSDIKESSKRLKDLLDKLGK